jgi:ubiquinol-cytochrome c reductase cytochrome b subunit
MAGIVILHLITIHNKGGTNTLGINTARSIGYINFHPYYTIKDILGIGGIIIILMTMACFYPNIINHSDNYIPANPMVTPTHIVPEIYLLYYYMGLRAIKNKTMGVIVLLGIIMVLLLAPYLHKGIITTSKFRPIYKKLLFILFIDFIFGTYLGGTEVEEPFITLSLITITYYYLFFMLMPIYSFIETFLIILSKKKGEGTQ